MNTKETTAQTIKHIVLEIEPMGAVRSQGKRSFKNPNKAKALARYVKYKEKLQWLMLSQGVRDLPNTLEYVIFKMPIPNPNRKGISKKDREKYLSRIGELHLQKPDLDNMLKGLLDANGKDDSHIACINGPFKKVWCAHEHGSICFGIKV